MSDKVQIAIDRLASLSPIVEKLMASTSSVEVFDDPETHEELVEDNIKLKDLVLSMSNTIKSLESIIEDLTEDLEEMRDSVQVDELTDTAKQNIQNMLDQSGLYFLLQVYGNPDIIDNLSPAAAPFVCNALIDKFELADRGSVIPDIWRKLAISNN